MLKRRHLLSVRLVVAHILAFLLCVAWFSQWSAAEGMESDAATVAIVVDAALRIGPEYGVDPYLLLAVAEVESEWNPFAGDCRESVGRGCGLYQQVPEWSGRWSDECWDAGRLVCRANEGQPLASGELLDVYTATRVAARQLGYLIDRYGVCNGLVAYNAGERGMRTADRRYCERVLRVRDAMVE